MRLCRIRAYLRYKKARSMKIAPLSCIFIQDGLLGGSLMDDPHWITQLSRWWALLALGTVVILFGLFTDNAITLGVGAMLAVIGACGESYNYIEAHVGPTDLVLKRETVEQAIFTRAR